ncbi:GIP [Symbiodinium microadriaticum]|nr:GIP [Symbiodinium microadriaticum]
MPRPPAPVPPRQCDVKEDSTGDRVNHEVPPPSSCPSLAEQIDESTLPSPIPEAPPPLQDAKAEEARGVDEVQGDAMSVVLKGMAQLQGLVSEMSTSPKQSEKPESVKPGVSSLPELPTPGAESCLLFSDWIHNSRPPLSDISDTSEELWEGVLNEASTWYAKYLQLDPLSRLVFQPEPSEFLNKPKWSRVSRRIETMILAALPATVRQEVGKLHAQLLSELEMIGCKKGSDCNFEHSWSAIPFEDRKGRCKTCGAKGHKAQECKAGMKEGEAKAKGKGSMKGAPKAAVEAISAVPTPPPPPAADSQQQIKSMLADAALILQQAMPQREGAVSGEGATQGVPIAGPPKAPSAGVAQGTPVTLASLSAQLDSLRAMTREYEAKMMRFEEERVKVEAVALLDSGATHPVVPFSGDMSGLQKVPVTLAGESKEEWYRTKGGTLVVPPRDPSAEDQALSLIAELEDKRLQLFKNDIQDLESRMELVSAPLDPTEALRQYAVSGERPEDNPFRRWAEERQIQTASKNAGVEDLFEEVLQRDPSPVRKESTLQEEPAETPGWNLIEDCAEYEPSEPGEPLDDEMRVRFGFSDEGDALGQKGSCQAVEVEDFESILAPRDPPKDPEELESLIKDLKTPVDQTVLRYVIPLRSKTGQDVMEGLQKMILEINKRYPVKILHSDPGTEFSSYALSRWAASQGIRVQHTLPTDKKGNGLAERIVGWIKSRVRTLLKAASLPIHWWPLAARWATQAHNRSVEGQSALPSFGHHVLHRTKTPKDADRQILGRWVKYRYAAPHSSIPDGHVLITESGNLVASKGFKDKVIDPLEHDEFKLPELEAIDDVLRDADSGVPEEAPLKRLRSKTAVRFVETTLGESAEEYSRECILKEHYSNTAFHHLMCLLMSEEGGTQDRRGDLRDKLVFGAYCHGGQRGVTKLTYRRPFTTQFLNQVLFHGLRKESNNPEPKWSSLMLMRSGDVPVHRDYRNEWGSKNHVLCIPGGLLLWTDEAFDHSKRVKVVKEPDWNSSSVTTVIGNTVSFDPRAPHAVRKQPEWLLVGYTPLGTRKLSGESRDYLGARGFDLPEVYEEGIQVAMVRECSDIDFHGDEALVEGDQNPQPGSLTSVDLEQDLQPDSSTTLVGWDFSRGDPADFPLDALDGGDLREFLEQRGVPCEYDRLTHLGVDEPSDLQYLYEEDLIEMGLPRIHAQRIMHGIHPEGTRRSDNPSLCGLQTGESRLLSRDQMFIPRVLQNRTLDPNWQGGPPLEGLGVREPIGELERGFPFQEEEDEVGVWEDEWVPFEELGFFPSDSPGTQVNEVTDASASSSDPFGSCISARQPRVSASSSDVFAGISAGVSNAALGASGKGTGAFHRGPGASGIGAGVSNAALGASGKGTGAFHRGPGASGIGAGVSSAALGASGKGTGAFRRDPGASGIGAGVSSAALGASGKGTGAPYRGLGAGASSAGLGAGVTDADTGALSTETDVQVPATGQGANGLSSFVGLDCGFIEPGRYVDPLEELGIFPSDSPTQVLAFGQYSEEGSRRRSLYQVSSRQRSASFPVGRRSRRSTSPDSSHEASGRVCTVDYSPDEPALPRETCSTKGTFRIGVPTKLGVTLDDVVQRDREFSAWTRDQPEDERVMKVDDEFFTPNVEGLLRELITPLKVVHNVSPSEVRKHLKDWIPASQAEVQALVDMKAIRRLFGEEAVQESRVPGTQVLPAKTVYTVKPGSGGNYFRRKCRVVGCGNYELKPGSVDVYASGIPADVLRSCLVEASARDLKAFITDIKNAFLLAPIPQGERTRILLRPPKILELMEITQPGELWYIERAVYGLRQSPRWWGEHRDEVLSQATWHSSEHGQVWLVQSGVESNLWKMTTSDHVTVGFVIIYVDDMMFLSTKEQADLAYTWIKARWECTPLEQATEQNPITFLGVEIHLETLATGERGFALCQKAYIEELARSYGLTLSNRSSPVPKEWVREMPELEEQPDDNTVRKAQKVTGEVLWVAQRSRPDVAHCVGLMASWITKVPTHVHKLGVRLIEFLYATMDQKLSMTPLRSARPSIVIYTDASFAPHGSRSVSGILVQYRGRNVLWKSQRQTIVCLSTAEAELVGACEGVVLGQSLTALLKEFDVRLGPMRLLVDNLAAIVLAEGGGSTRTRHLRVRGSFIKDLIKANELIPEHCPGDVQLADILTKILAGPRHQALCELLGLGLPTQIARISQDEQNGYRVDETCLSGLKSWLISLMFMMQLQCGTSSTDDDDQGGVSPELSLVIVMMALSVLFVWEAGKFCVRTCCTRGEHRVQSVRQDEEDSRTRRARRQEAVRRAIVSEAEGLRRRREVFTEEEDEDAPVPPPPPPPFPVGDRSRSTGQIGLDQPATSSAYLPLSSNQGVGFAQEAIPPPPTGRVESSSGAKGVMCDAGTQTEEPRGITYDELHRLQVLTSTSRTPGVVHIFPGCHTLRGVTTNRRQFCRVCLQAAARSGV